MDFTVDSGDTNTSFPVQGEAIDLSALSFDTYSITSGGSYTLSGSKTDTMILVDAENAARGYVSLSGGKLDIATGKDGIQAGTVINAENTNLTVWQPNPLPPF